MSLATIDLKTGKTYLETTSHEGRMSDTYAYKMVYICRRAGNADHPLTIFSTAGIRKDAAMHIPTK
jgi:hypothetical protein